MSVVLAGGFPSSKHTEENSYGPGSKVTKGSNRTFTQPVMKHSLENPANPQKTFNGPLQTPRKVLGELSNNTKTPASTLKCEQQSTQKKPHIKSVTKRAKIATKGSKDAMKKKPTDAATLTSQTHRQRVLKEEDFPDIEMMPTTEEKDHPFVAPSYFRNLTAALFNPLPVMSDFPQVGVLGSLSLSSDLRPLNISKDGPLEVDSLQVLESTPFENLTPVEMPEIPDFNNL